LIFHSNCMKQWFHLICLLFFFLFFFLSISS
jgi:hypothetical protein